MIHYQQGFKIVSNYKTAYIKDLDELFYDPTKPLGNSSHNVYKGKTKQDKGPNKKNEIYIKEVANDVMAYVEAFQSQLYFLSLLYGVARAYVRMGVEQDNVVIKISSEGLTRIFHEDTKITCLVITIY